MRRFALIVLLSVFATFLGVDGHETAPAAHAAALGGNGKLAFVTLAGQIATVNPDGSGLNVLAPGSEPAWSPDGKKIAFNSGSGIAVMDGNGSNRVNLPAGTQDAAPAWSPDGKKIAFRTFVPDPRGLIPELWVMDAGGGNRSKLVDYRCCHFGTPSWSPDGTRLVLDITVSSGHSGLATVSSAGGALVDLTGPPQRRPHTVPTGHRMAVGLSSMSESGPQ